MTPGVFRFFLASCVVVHHSFPLRLGAWAVGLFFVLSGFWVTRMWRTSYANLDHGLYKFYLSRWIRLAPLFMLAQLLACVSSYLSSSRELPSFTGTAWWWVTQFTVLGSTCFGRLLPPAWSLDVEAQFYFFAPLIVSAVVLITRPKLGNNCFPTFSCRSVWLGFSLILAFAIWSYRQLSVDVSMDTARLDLYVWLFLVGIYFEVLGWRPSSRLVWLSAVGFIILTTLFLSFPTTRSAIWIKGASGDTNPSGSLAYYFLATVIALPVALDTVHRKSNIWDAWLGDLSYALYLFHWFPRDWYYANLDLNRGNLSNLSLLFANFAMAFSAAALCLQFVDRPIQRWRKRCISANRISA